MLKNIKELQKLLHINQILTMKAFINHKSIAKRTAEVIKIQSRIIKFSNKVT